MKQGKWELVDLYPGCHIRIKVNNYYHHGIYVGGGEVIQFGLPFDPLKNGEYGNIKVIKSPLKDFSMGNNFIEVYVYSKAEQKKKQKDEDIIKEAYRLLGSGGYNILTNNCEHFANWCCFREKKSSQIDEVYQNVKNMLNDNK